MLTIFFISAGKGFLGLTLFTSLACAISSVDVPYVAKVDRDRFSNLFLDGVAQKDIGGIHFSVLGLKLLNSPIPSVVDLCKQLPGLVTKEAVDAYFFLSVAWKAASCSGAVPNSAAISKYLTSTLEKEGSTTSDLYYSVFGLKALGLQIPHGAKVAKTLQAAIKKDDSISSLAHGLHVAAELGAADGGFMYQRIEDIIVQADEVDGKYLQFEGGLTITALVINGVYKLSNVMSKPPPLSAEQAVKFGNYFLSRKPVQTSKGAWSLLNVLKGLTSNKFEMQFQRPLVVSLQGVEAEKITVRITDLLGDSVGAAPISVTLDLLSKATTGAAVLAKTKFEQVPSDKTLFSVKLPSSISPGFYKATVSVAVSDPVLIGGKSNLLEVKVTGVLDISDPFLIAPVDSDNFLQPKFKKVEYSQKLPEILDVDSLQRLAIRFNLKEKSSKKPATVHQAFIRLAHIETGQELIFVAEEDANNLFKLDLDIGAKANEFGHLSGGYYVELIAGDSVYSNSIQWRAAQVKISFAGEPKTKSTHQSVFSVKPEIKHLFREPEKRPPVFVSNLFTGLILLPLLVLFILWFKLGINISNFSFHLSTIGFHLGLGSIFCLFGLFWLRLDMFETLKYLLVLGLLTFISGNKLLASVAKHKS